MSAFFLFCKKISVAAAIAGCCLLSCSKSPVKEDAPESPEMQSFVIERGHNPTLDADIVFTFKGDSILADHPFLYSKNLVPSFTFKGAAVFIKTLRQESGAAAVDFSNVQTYSVVSEAGAARQYHVKINWIIDSVPHIYINTEGGVGITSKDDYVKATIIIDGKGKFADLPVTTTRIRGRGNSTWDYDKKPYRLKLDETVSLFGLKPEKDWVLLANYLDPTLMLNATAMKIGQQLALPYTNTIIPVNLTVNGQYAGSYNFTEQVEAGDNRVNVGDDGWLLELDSYYDETYKFRSAVNNLPVNIKHPGLTTDEELGPIRSAFTTMENLLGSDGAPDAQYKEHIDVESVAKFLIVNFLTGNGEINHPKSVYMYKTATGKFMMGPIWDFDWAYGYDSPGSHFQTATWNPFWTPGSAGTWFFKRFLADPSFVVLLQQHWSNYKTQRLEDLIKYVEQYGLMIRTAKAADYLKWNNGVADNQAEVAALQQWLRSRAQYIDTFISGL